ncbi:MAG TPA: DNA-binding response regulator [Nitrospira sp.]|jgi:DNA-binding NarL/FixJ family response regulator|uniref:response regulator n=1 Tax=Nitrospira sp. BLG_1 TaxID=3395883 RepID=UPI000E923166|nr:response regulator transcription factor [Nitrospira sp.]HBR50761.1 DNA-binding response regulator [Nitrospira sp.]
MSKPRVLLADDHALVLEGFKKLLEEHCQVVGSVEDGRALLDAAKRLQPDIVVLDISMPKLNGLDAARRLRKMIPQPRLIFVTVHADQDYVTQAFKAGASAYLLKRSAGSELLQAIDAVKNDNYYITSLIAKDLVQAAIADTASGADGQDRLPIRQREILQLVAEGLTLKEIASTLGLSPKTVEYHKAKLMEQLGLHTTAELTKYALAHGLTSSSE